MKLCTYDFQRCPSYSTGNVWRGGVHGAECGGERLSKNKPNTAPRASTRTSRHERTSRRREPNLGMRGMAMRRPFSSHLRRVILFVRGKAAGGALPSMPCPNGAVGEPLVSDYQRECSHGVAVIGAIQRGVMPTKRGREPVQVEDQVKRIARRLRPAAPRRRGRPASGLWHSSSFR